MSSSTQREYVSISSKQRIQNAGGTPFNYTIQLNQPLQGIYSLKTLILPLSWYNVSIINNTLSLSDNGTERITIIQPGIYTAVSIASAIQDAITAVSPNTWTVSFNGLNGIMTIQSSTAFILRSMAPGLLPLIGYPVGVYNSTGFGLVNTTLSPQIVNLGTNLSLNFRISNCNTRVVDSNGNSSTFNVPITGLLGGTVLVYEPDLGKSAVYLDFTTPQRTLTISVVDVDGVFVALLSDYEMIFEKVE
jgi:hypothetical protein